MGKTKVAISIEQKTLTQIDRLVKKHVFPNRSQAIQEAVQEKLKRLGKSGFARECCNLNPAFEKALAEEGLSEGTDS